VLCGADPYANEETFTAPSQQQQQQQQQQQLGDDEVTTTTSTGSLQQFILSLLRLIDESCVPVFMVNLHFHRNVDIHLTIVLWKTGMHWFVSFGLQFLFKNFPIC